MARSLWSGLLAFGLVNVPVGLFPATRDQTMHFNQLRKGTSHRVRYRKVDEETGEELSSDAIVRGYDLGGGEYVLISPADLKSAAAGRSETQEIVDFVDLGRIDPVFFRQSYYLAPGGKGSDRAYALLLRAMRDTKKVGIASFVLRDKEHLVAVRPGGKALILETMYFADEIRDPQRELDTLPGEVEFTGRELDVARQLVHALTSEWEPEKYTNSYRERVEQLLELKRQGRSVVSASQSPKTTIVDLMSALEASLARSATSGDRVRIAGDRAAARVRPRRSGSTGASAHVQQSFEGMSKAELPDHAAKLAVPGRSRMSKLELVKALSPISTAPENEQRVS